MSNTNYDVELNLSYDYAYRHYYIYYDARAPYYKHTTHSFPSQYYHMYYDYYVSFDDGPETHFQFDIKQHDKENKWLQSEGFSVPDNGPHSKIYFRNGQKSQVGFNTSNCDYRAKYSSKAPFEVRFNSIGFAANENPTFKCSTVQKPTYMQYEWNSATVYYKKASESSYQSASATVSGTWSDVTVSTTDLTLEDDVDYNIYIRAVGDDGSVANTPVGTFNTVDAEAVATCIAPSGAFLNGECTFVWAHSTAYGTPQYAYDLQYSLNNGGSWTTVKNHEITRGTTTTVTLENAGVYIWRVRTYNSNDVAGEWAQASFVNNAPAVPPTNVSCNTQGRPTVSWTIASQSAYQVQFLGNGNRIEYDSGAVYTAETSHFVNKYFDDTMAYTVRVRVYNALGEVSDWASVGYQQPEVENVDFTVESNGAGAVITITPSDELVKYYLLRNGKLISEISNLTYTDKYAVGLTNYSVVGVTSEDQSDIKTNGCVVKYNHATIITLDGQKINVNKRMNESFEVSVSNEADINKVSFIGDSTPTHYPSDMRLKSFTIAFMDEEGNSESLLGTLVFYADNFGNGGYCMVTSYSKKDSFIRTTTGTYANEVTMTLEVTNYDDSIEYPL